MLVIFRLGADQWVLGQEGMSTDHAQSCCILIEGDNGNFFGITFNRWFYFLDLAIMILSEPESIIFTLFWENDSVFLFFFDICLAHILRSFMVIDVVLRLNYLNRDVAIFDLWVRDCLHIVIFDPLIRHDLVVGLEVII